MLFHLVRLLIQHSLQQSAPLTPDNHFFQEQGYSKNRMEYTAKNLVGEIILIVLTVVALYKQLIYIKCSYMIGEIISLMLG